MFHTSISGFVLALDNPINVAFTVTPTKRGPDVVALIDGLRVFVLDLRGHLGF